MAITDVPTRRHRRRRDTSPAAPVEWGTQHDRLLTFVYRTFDCCVRDQAEASAMTVELLANHDQLVDRPNLDDEATRAELVPLMAAALRERASGAAIRVALGHAAVHDSFARRPQPTADVHGVLSTVGSFTRHLRFTT
ncbi:hypothetical protein [Actinokineospora sp.]|uniref:hypothetical protein n=1 Tax=Actinokineospora sp. TaxID=1872133 RepID=UPI004037876C